MGSVNKYKTQFLRKLCVFIVLVFFTFVTDVCLAAPTSPSGNDTPFDQQYLTRNHPCPIKQGNDDYQHECQRSKPTNTLLKNVFGLPRAFRNLAGNVIKGAADALNNINPFKDVLPHEHPSTITTHVTSVTTDEPGGTGADSFQGEPIATTSPKPTTPVKTNGAQNMLDSVFGKNLQTTQITQTRATVAPPAGGHGRGVPAIVFNIKNILQNTLEVIGAILHWTQHSEPGYIISKIQSSFQSVEALKDIYLQRNLEGGIGDIPKHVEAILKNIGSLTNSITHDPGNMIQMIITGQALLQDIGKLEGDFIESPSTTAAPGGLIGNILQGIGVLGKKEEPRSNQSTKSLQQRYGEFGNVVQSTGKLVYVLGKIEEDIQDRLPNSTLLQMIGKLKDLAEVSLTNNTLDNENILDVIQKIFFPNSTLAQIVGNFGKTLNKIFPNSNTVQVIGNILQQKLLVDLALNIVVRSASFLRFGNIKDFVLQSVGNVGNEIIGDNLNKLLAGGISVLERMVEIFESFLKIIIQL